MSAHGSRTSPDRPESLPTGVGAGTGATTSTGSESPVHHLDWVSLGAVVLLLVAAGATHGAVFGSCSGYVAVAGGIVIGTLVALAGARWRWNPLEVLLAAVISYLLAGGPLALPTTTGRWGVPTMATLQGLVIGAVTSWKDLLTIAPPAASFVGPGIVPYLSGLLCSLVAVTITLRAGCGSAGTHRDPVGLAAGAASASCCWRGSGGRHGVDGSPATAGSYRGRARNRRQARFPTSYPAPSCRGRHRNADTRHHRRHGAVPLH